MTTQNSALQKQNGSEQKSNFKRMTGYAKKYRSLIIFSIIFALFQAASQLLAPIFMGKAIDKIVSKDNVNMHKVAVYSIYMATAVAAAFLFGWLMNLCASGAAQRTSRDIRIDMFKKLNHVPLKAIDGFNHGDLLARITSDAEKISDGLVLGFTQLFAGAALVVGTLCFMLSINFVVAAFVAVLTPLSFFAAMIIAKRAQRLFSKQARAEGELSGLSEEFIANQRIIKLFGYEKRAQKRFDSLSGEIEQHGGKATFISAIINPGTRLINGFVYLTVLLAGAYLLIDGPSWAAAGLGVGGIATFLSYALQYAKPFNEISATYAEMQTALVSAKRVFDVLDLGDEPNESHLPDIKANNGEVEFKNVDFSYTDTPFIEGFNLLVNMGQRVAIIGRTGCGKTTLLSLIMRFYEVDGGAIAFGGNSIKEANRDSVRQNVGMVLQDTWLKTGTIRENIAYGKPSATFEQIKEAAQKARIDGFISRLSGGYDTVLSLESLSAGQMQLLSIARVFLSLPPILILDEATSSIDARTELKITEALKEMTAGHTCFIVAHRLATIRNADLILVMDSGKIIERGTHGELLEQNGAYARLLNDLEKGENT